jgi:hypothetical protein
MGVYRVIENPYFDPQIKLYSIVCQMAGDIMWTGEADGLELELYIVLSRISLCCVLMKILPPVIQKCKI